MYPKPVDPTPTLIPSTRTLSPTANGKELMVLNPTDNVAVTVSSAVLKTTVLIPTPALLCVGMIVGVTLLIPLVFFKISTLDSPRVTFRSTSVTCF